MKLQRWRFRSRIFKLGFCGVLLSAVLCAMGFLAPAWQNSGGLWMYDTPPHPLPGWMQAVRVLVTLSVSGLCVSILVEMHQDMCSRTPPSKENFLVEMSSALSGFLGLTAVTLFAVKAYVSYPPGEGPFGPCTKKVFWAWGLHLVGSITAIMSAALMASSRSQNRTRSRRQMDVFAFRQKAPVVLNPYFVSRCIPAVQIVPVTQAQDVDSHV